MRDEHSPQQPQSTPGVATAEQGVVLLDGPDGVAIAMTPNAAEITGHRLIAAAEEAANQSGEAAQSR
jgi:hypothetical protein